MLDPNDPEYQLRWPHALFLDELHELLHGGLQIGIVGAVDLLFQEALAGQQPQDDLADALRRDQAAAYLEGSADDEYSINRTVAFIEEVLAAADRLPAFQPRQYWIARQTPPSPPSAKTETKHLSLQRQWDALFVELDAAGYFDRTFGSNCADDPAASTRDSRIVEHLEQRTGIPDFVWTWPPSAPRKAADAPDVFYSLLEVMHDAVARPSGVVTK